MSADIIQFIPRYNPKKHGTTNFTPSQSANTADESIPYAGQGIDGMWTDTAPSEYVAPLDDPA